MSDLNTLKDLYIDQLQDLVSAHAQSEAVTRKLAEAATDQQLAEALAKGADEIANNREELAKLCRDHGTDPKGEHCAGMEGLVVEARKHALDAKFGDDDVRDAMIITQYQRMTHYGLAGYGCVLAFAGRLGLQGDAETLKRHLDGVHEGDRAMTAIAEQNVNQAAA